MDDRRGFTIVEMLVAIVIGGVAAGSVIQLVGAHARFVETQAAQEDALRNARAVLEQIGSELRAMPPAGLVRAASDSITFRTAAAWGVVCSPPMGNTLDVTFPAIADFSFPTHLGAGIVVDVGTAESSSWTTAVSLLSVSRPEATCAADSVSVGAERRTLTLGGIPAGGARAPKPGDVAYIFEKITYRAGPVAPSGRWIQRRIGDGPGTSNQPFAGPIAEGSRGFGLEYFAGRDASSLAAPIVHEVSQSLVSRIAIRVEAVGTPASAGNRPFRAARIEVAPRSLP